MTHRPELTEYFSEASRLVELIDADAVERAADVIMSVHEHRGIVFSCGNGGSASTASHFASDLAKFVGGVRGAGIRAICLNDSVPLHGAWTNDAGFDAAFTGPLRGWLSGSDAVVVFSVHGGPRAAEPRRVSSNLSAACALARERGAKVIGLTGFDGGGIGELADVHINVPIDREPLATPLIESLHVLAHHAICTALRNRIESTGAR